MWMPNFGPDSCKILMEKPSEPDFRQRKERPSKKSTGAASNWPPGRLMQSVTRRSHRGRVGFDGCASEFSLLNSEFEFLLQSRQPSLYFSAPFLVASLQIR